MTATRPRKSAAASAFGPAFLLVIGGTVVYGVLIRGNSVFRKLTWEQTALVGVVFLVVWLVFWALIAARRRRSDRRRVGEA